jgi:hypothetical protein
MAIFLNFSNLLSFDLTIKAKCSLKYTAPRIYKIKKNKLKTKAIIINIELITYDIP